MANEITGVKPGTIALSATINYSLDLVFHGESGSSYWTQRGKIFQTDFDDISEWTNDGTFSSVADDALIAFDPLPVNFKRTIGGLDDMGVRNVSAFKENGIFYIVHSGPNTNLTEEFMERWAHSSNGGKVWIKEGILTPQVDGLGDPVTMSTLGWVMKEGSYYYFFRVLQKDSIDDPTYGFLSSGPYTCDIWRSTAMDGTWEWLADLPQFNISWADSSCLPGSMIKVGSTYYYCLQAMNASTIENVGFATGNSISGPFTLAADPVLTKTMLDNFYRPENPRVFYHPIFEKYVLVCNAYNYTAGVFKLQNTVQISSSISNWASASLRRFQSSDADMDSTNVVGMPCPVITPDGGVVVGNNNFIPLMYDMDGIDFTPLYLLKRTISTVMLEPSRYALRFDGSVSGAIRRAEVNSDFVAEFGVEFDSYTGSELVGFVFRSDGTGDNEYILQIQNGGAKLKLIKVVGGTPSVIETSLASQTTILDMINRIKVVVSGTSIKAYIDGQLQINSTDSAFSSGTHIGFYGESGANTDIRAFHLRLADTFIINGLKEGTEVELRADGGICAASELADSSGIVTFTLSHWPMESFYLNGVDYPISGGIWGGDEYTFSRLSIPTPVRNTIVSATVEDANPDDVIVTFTENLNETLIPDISAFSLTGKTISSVSISNKILTIKVSVSYIYGDVIGNLVYTRPSTYPLRSNPDTTYIDSFTKSVTNNVAVVDEYADVLSAMTNEPSAADKIIQNTWLKGMVDGGYFVKAELLDLFSVHTNNANEALINWKNPGTFNPSGVNSPSFEAYAGFTGAVAGTKYVRLNFIPSSDGTLISENSVCVIVGVQGSGSLGDYDFGCYDGTTAIFIQANNEFNSPDSAVYYCNNIAAAQLVTTTTEICHLAVSRGADANFDTYINTSKTNKTATSNNVVTKELYTCGRNNNGTAVPGRRQIRYIFVFSYLTPTEVTAVINLTEAYLDNYGKGLIA